MSNLITKLPRNYQLIKNAAVFFRLVPTRFTSQQPHCPPPGSSKPPQKSRSTGTAYSIAALALIGLGTIGYAKYDPEFRSWLTKNVPKSNEFLSFIFQEEKSVGKSLTEWASKTQKSVIDSIGISPEKKKEKIDKDSKEYCPPSPVFPSLLKPEKEETYEEIRVLDEKKNDVEIVKEKPKSSDIYGPSHPKNLIELEEKICDSAKAAMENYKNALHCLREYNQSVEEVVDTSVEILDERIWPLLKKKSAMKNEYIENAEKNAKVAFKKLQELKICVQDKDFIGTADEKAAINRTMERYINDINSAKTDLEKEKHLTNLTDKYWTKVSAARCHFIEELEILFPGIDVSNKTLTMAQADIDLFLVHAFSHVNYYMKELHKSETIGNQKLQDALEKLSKNDPNFDATEIRINDLIEKEKRRLDECYQRKCLALRKDSEKELRHRLKVQAEAHQDHLNDAIRLREQELERVFCRKLDEELAKEQAKYKIQLAGLMGRVKGMRNVIQERIEADKQAQKSQMLWSACQALYRAVKIGQPGISWKEQMKPLEHEINEIKNAASENDELVKVVLQGIPQEATTRGVFPENALRERFLKVERIARRLALVPDNGCRLPLYLLSFLQSLLVLPSVNPIPKCELDDEVTDFSKLNTYDILQRARYYMERGNYAQTLRYMNLLKGASRSIANEWMRETRLLLETQQAAEALMAHAVAGGLAHS